MKRRDVAFAALASAAALGVSALAACSDLADLGGVPVLSSDSGSQTQPLAEGADAAHSLDAGGSTCGACVASRCGAESTACAASSACAAYEDCLVPCGGDYACRSRCLVASYASASAIPAMDQCVAAQCATECGLSCGMTSSYAEPDAATACVACITASSCDTAQACGTDLGCQQIVQCELDSVTEDGFFGCSDVFDGGADFVSYVATAERCAGPCAAGGFWDCSATTTPPLSTAGQTVITLNLVAFPTGGPLAGATVKACARSDTACTQPVVAPGTTDADGNVTFTLAANGPVGFAGYFDVQSTSIYPSLLFLAAPLSVPRVTLPGVLVPEPATVQGFYTSAGVALDPSLGTVEIQATDCHWGVASGVTAQLQSSDAGASFAYFVNGQLSLRATGTDEAGYAVLLGAPVTAPLTLSMTPSAVGHPVAITSLFARPGAWSFEIMRPE